MLLEESLLLKAGFLEDAGRGGIVREHMRGDLHQAPFGKRQGADLANRLGHDPTAPEWSGEPVADLGPMRCADLKFLETDDADQLIGFIPDDPMARLTLLLRRLGN